MPYDIAGALQNPNIIGNALAAARMGRADGLAAQEAQKTNALASLAGQAYTAAPEQRNALIGQAVGIDPQIGMRLGTQLQTNDDSEAKKVAGAAKMVLDAYKSGNPAQVQGAYRETIPLLTRLGAPQGKVPPAQFSEDMLPGLYQIVARAGGENATGMPSGFREFEMTARAAGLVPGTPEYQQAANIALGREGRASNAGMGFQKVTGADGRERIGRSNPRTGTFEVYNEQTGQFEPMGGAAGQPQVQQMTPEQIMAQGTQMANQGGPGANTAAAEAWMRQQLPNVQPAQPESKPGLAVSRSPEETAAAVEAAKQQVGLQYLPEQKAIENQAAIQQEQGKAQVKNAADLSLQASTKQRDAQGTLALLDVAEKILPSATGSAAGSLTDRAAAGVGISTEGAQATAQLQTIAGQLTSKMPRMQGPQSDRDVELYKQMAGDLANPSLPVATRQAALQTIRVLNEKYAGGNQLQTSDRVLHYNPATGRIE